MTTVTGTLDDAGAGHLAGRAPQLSFWLDKPGRAMDGSVVVTDPVTVTPAADGSFSIVLQDVLKLIDADWYHMRIDYLGGNQIDYPDWRLYPTGTAGTLTDFSSIPFSQSALVFVGPDAPVDPRPGSFWINTGAAPYPTLSEWK